MASALVWAHLPAHTAEAVPRLLHDRAALADALADVLALSGAPSDAVLLDLFYYLLKFAVEHRMQADKLSTLFSIVWTVHSDAHAQYWTAERAFERFEQLLQTHSVQRPPFAVRIFSIDDVRDITDYLTNTYFRHYLLYQYCFGMRHELTVRTTRPPAVLAPPLPPSLRDAEPIIDAGAQHEHEHERALPVGEGGDSEAAGGEGEGEGEADVDGTADPMSTDAVQRLAQRAVRESMASLQETLIAQLMAQQEELLARVAAIEEKAGVGPAAAAAAAAAAATAAPKKK